MSPKGPGSLRSGAAGCGAQRRPTGQACGEELAGPCPLRLCARWAVEHSPAPPAGTGPCPAEAPPGHPPAGPTVHTAARVLQTWLSPNTPARLWIPSVQPMRSWALLRASTVALGQASWGRITAPARCRPPPRSPPPWQLLRSPSCWGLLRWLGSVSASCCPGPRARRCRPSSCRHPR